MYLREAGPIEVPELHAGDIGAIGKLDVMHVPETPFLQRPIRLPYAKLRYFCSVYIQEIHAQSYKGEEDKVAQALAEDGPGRSDHQGSQ